MIKELSSLDVRGKKVLLRCDLNVPLKDDGKGERVITDDGRIRASLPTIKYLLDRGATLVIAAHLGRPKGEKKPELSLAPIAKRLEELLGRSVYFSHDTAGPEADAAVSALKSGDVQIGRAHV